MQIWWKQPSKGNADTKNVHRAADVWVHPQTNEAFVADVTAITVSSSSMRYRRVQRMWAPSPTKPVDDDHCENVPQPSFSDDAGPQNFSIVARHPRGQRWDGIRRRSGKPAACSVHE